MHVPRPFAVSDTDVTALLARCTAGELITHSDADGLAATPLPFLHVPGDGPHGALHGHLSRANDQWRHADGTAALVLLRGADGYVSPGWYPSKQEGGRVVPTWDYTTVHVHGELEVHDDAAWCRDVVERLTRRHEQDRAQPWSVDDAPADWLAGQLRGIVGVALRITRVQAKAKLSQNRPAEDVSGVLSGLRAEGAHVLADDVERAR